MATIGSSIDEIAPLRQLAQRNRAAEEIIAQTAKNHALFDGATAGVSGFVPGGTFVAFLWQLRRQRRVLFPDMIHQLAFVYGAEVDEVVRHRSTKVTWEETGAQFVTNELVLHGVRRLGADLGTDFLWEMVPDLLREGGAGMVVGLIPILGAGVSAVLDATIAATVTWRVGTMIALYYQNGGYIQDRKHTYNTVKKDLVQFNPDWDRPGTLERIQGIAPVTEAMVRKVRSLAQTLLLANPDKDRVRRILTGKGDGEMGFPSDVVAAALAGL